MWIWQASGDWEYDDSNYTTLPIATQDLTDNQESVTLPTEIFKIERVEVLDSTGNYQALTPVDQSEFRGTALTEFQKTAGMPKYFDLFGSSVVFYPKVAASSVTLTAGVKIVLARDTDPFVSTDTTKKPGFSAYFHRIVSVGMALDYAMKQGLTDKIVALTRIIYGDPSVPDNKGLKSELQEAYGSRNRTRKNNLRVTEKNSPY